MRDYYDHDYDYPKTKKQRKSFVQLPSDCTAYQSDIHDEYLGCLIEARKSIYSAWVDLDAIFMHLEDADEYYKNLTQKDKQFAQKIEAHTNYMVAQYHELRKVLGGERKSKADYPDLFPVKSSSPQPKKKKAAKQV